MTDTQKNYTLKSLSLRASSRFSNSDILGFVAIASIANLLGALMEGGATPVLESIQKRNQTAIETLSNQKNAWFLPAGESAQIVVSRLFEL